MHELGLCEAILAAVERRAAGRRVARVRIRAGTLLRVVEPALDQAFALVADGTVAEGATVELIVVPLRATCRVCQHVEEADEIIAVCPACGATDVELAGGEELTLESIELAATV